MELFPRVFAELNRRGVRYVVVGGLAVLLHGHARLTMDIDLVVALDNQNALSAIEALAALGLVPRNPVAASDFADVEIRQRWKDEKNLLVFTMIDPMNPFFAVDLFVDPPISYEDLGSRAQEKAIDGVHVPVCSLADLIQMKQMSGREQDLADIEALGGIP